MPDDLVGVAAVLERERGRRKRLAPPELSTPPPPPPPVLGVLSLSLLAVRSGLWCGDGPLESPEALAWLLLRSWCTLDMNDLRAARVCAGWAWGVARGNGAR